MAREQQVRRPLRAGPDRSEDAEEPLLPGSPLHRLRSGEALVPGPPSERQGRRGLGCGLHRVLLHQRAVRRGAAVLGPSLGRERRGGSQPDVQRSPRSRCPRRSGAPPRGRPFSATGFAYPVGRPIPAGGGLHDSRPLGAEGDGPRRHPAAAGRLGEGGRAGGARRVRHRLRLRGAHLPARPVPVPLLQQARGRVRGIPRESGAPFGSRYSTRSGRRSASAVPSRSGWPSTRWAARASRSTRRWAS